MASVSVRDFFRASKASKVLRLPETSQA